MEMGLQGMINDLMEKSDFPTGRKVSVKVEEILKKDKVSIARLISAAENNPKEVAEVLDELSEIGKNKKSPVLGITGTGGAGKSSLVDEIVRRFLLDFPDKTIAIISVDPSKRKSGGALLGDRIRMNAIDNPRVYMRSLATRQSNLSISKYVKDAEMIAHAAGFDLVILETSGIGQSDTAIVDHSDVSLYVMTPEYGAATQLEKIDMLDFADIIALNKFDKRGAQDALRDVKKQYQRNNMLFDQEVDDMPVFGTVASQFNDPGVNEFYKKLLKTLNEKANADFNSELIKTTDTPEKIYIIPPQRVRYLSEISETVRDYNKWAEDQSEVAQKLFSISQSIDELKANGKEKETESLKELYEDIVRKLDPNNLDLLKKWPEKKEKYGADKFTFKVRNNEFNVETKVETLSHLQIPKVSLPKFKSWGEILKWVLKENVPGEFPFAAGVFPFKREGEDPTRMFAGEGGPERTNRRFHYVSHGMPAKRLSTAFDSVTLYGEDPDRRPDIYGKIGNSGVSIANSGGSGTAFNTYPPILTINYIIRVL
jgi:methylmalonyl-CoA mutase